MGKVLLEDPTKDNRGKLSLPEILGQDDLNIRDMKFQLTYKNNLMIAVGLFSYEKDRPKELVKLCYMMTTKILENEEM